MTSTLSELTCLQLHRPGLQAAVGELADYYAELHHVHEQLAAEAHSLDERTHELELANAALARVFELRFPTTTPEVI